ncbi:MAG: LPS assembly lipoprotein LptE [Gammaproteobacteria bacterium]|nr:LPS assembly lipoprotein LptE [Gammaproteobacteria bacterium]
MRRLAYLVVGISLLLGGCGFQMRGDWQLPSSMKQTVMSGGGRVLYETLQREFRAASASLTRPEGDIQTAHLTILKNQMDKRVLSVDNRGKVIEYEIYYILHFKLLDENGNQIVPVQQINMTRDYPYAATDVLGASQEEALLRNEMYGDMARQMMRRIQALAK